MTKDEILIAYPLEGLFDDLYDYASKQPVEDAGPMTHKEVLQMILYTKAMACAADTPPQYNVFLYFFRQVKRTMLDGAGVCGRYPRICEFVTNGRKYVRILDA